jgi:hypothetical protein
VECSVYEGDLWSPQKFWKFRTGQIRNNFRKKILPYEILSAGSLKYQVIKISYFRDGILLLTYLSTAVKGGLNYLKVVINYNIVNCLINCCEKEEQVIRLLIK